MFERWYAIVGLTPAMVDDWKENMRKDIIIWEEDGIVQARIRLNPIEALWMKYQMRRNNRKKEMHYYFTLLGM